MVFFFFFFFFFLEGKKGVRRGERKGRGRERERRENEGRMEREREREREKENLFLGSVVKFSFRIREGFGGFSQKRHLGIKSHLWIYN